MYWASVTLVVLISVFINNNDGQEMGQIRVGRKHDQTLANLGERRK